MTTSYRNQTPANGSNPEPDIDQIQADVERTREDLAETVDALSAKLDVKTRTKQRLVDIRSRAAGRLDAAKIRTNQLTAQVKQKATDERGNPTPAVRIGTGIVTASLVATSILVWHRRRR